MTISHTATFLFTDLENSTPLWEKHPDLMQKLIARHDELMHEAIEANLGQVVKTTGDGVFAIFDTASHGVAAALEGQQAIIREPWPAETGPLHVRMGLHTGESQLRDGDYHGAEVNRAARVMGLAHGGQVLVSGATAGLIRTALPADMSLSDLGQHRLRGLAAAEQLFQLCHPALPADFPPLKSLSVYKHNLPVRLTSFVGRQKELADVQLLLKETHLLTLLGPGGTGKTRLMLEVAEEIVGEYEDGIWLVELAPLTNPGLIAERVASALNVQEQPGRVMLDSLVDYLRQKELLLLLDNVEHLIRGAAELAEYLLTHCPRLKILVTGREAMFIAGERTLQIPSLSLPEGDGALSPEEISASEGVRLFLDRAHEIHPDFELGPENAAAIADVVRRLDGIPLALELAAARLRMLTVQQIADRLNDRFRLLTGGRRTALPRQQTLQAMIDWSWNLLDEKEQVLLRRLSVFSGGWTLEAAQAVTAAVTSPGDVLLDGYDVFDAMQQLVNKSLVTVSYPADGGARYGMLESIRQYGRDRLFEAGEGAAVRHRHAGYFVAFAEDAAPHLGQSTVVQWTSRIKLELDNLRAVLAWTMDDRPELALRIGGSLLYLESYWLTPKEARTWLEPAIEKTRALLDKKDMGVRTEDFIRALLGLTFTNGIQGYSAVALALAEEAIQLARKAGESHLLAYALTMKAIQFRFRKSAEAMQAIEEAVAIARENNFDEELALSLMIYAEVLEIQGETELAIAPFQEAVEVSRKSGIRRPASTIGAQARLVTLLGSADKAKNYIASALEEYEALNDRRGIVMSQSALAHISRREGNLEDAEAYYRQTIVGWQEQGHRSAVAHQLECFAYIAIARGRNEHAARLLGAATETRERLDALSEDPEEINELATVMAQLAEAMGAEERDRIMAEGRLIDLDDAVQMAAGG